MRARARWFASILLATCGVLAVWAVPGFAEPLVEIEGRQLDVRADSLVVDVRSGTAQLRGNVSFRLAELRVQCDRVDVKYEKAPRVRRARCTGNVRAELKDIRATARRLDLDATKRTVALAGDVKVRRGSGVLRASSARIDLATQRVSMERVSGSIPIPEARDEDER